MLQRATQIQEQRATQRQEQREDWGEDSKGDQDRPDVREFLTQDSQKETKINHMWRGSSHKIWNEIQTKRT